MEHLEQMAVCTGYRGGEWQLPVAVPPWCQGRLLAWRVNPPPVDAGMPGAVAALFSAVLVQQGLVSFAAGRGGFLHASRPEEAALAFEQPGYDWGQRGQVLFLSPKADGPPALSERHLKLAYQAENFAVLSGLGLTGLLLPGVDGDVAGLYTFSPQLGDQLTGALQAASEATGGQWRNLTEAELSDWLAA